jgi:hypothetical protein
MHSLRPGLRVARPGYDRERQQSQPSGDVSNRARASHEYLVRMDSLAVFY